jgi:hypothetical protein
MNLTLRPSILTLHSAVDRTYSKLHVPAAANVAVVVVKFFLTHKRVACGYDNTVQRYFGAARKRTRTEAWEKRHRLRFRVTARFSGDEVSVLGRAP